MTVTQASSMSKEQVQTDQLIIPYMVQSKIKFLLFFPLYNLCRGQQSANEKVHRAGTQ